MKFEAGTPVYDRTMEKVVEFDKLCADIREKEEWMQISFPEVALQQALILTALQILIGDTPTSLQSVIRSTIANSYTTGVLVGRGEWQPPEEVDLMTYLGVQTTKDWTFEKQEDR